MVCYTIYSTNNNKEVWTYVISKVHKQENGGCLDI